MNMWLLAFFGIIVLIGVAYWVFFTGKGRKIRILMYEKGKDGQAIQLYLNKKLFGYIRRKKEMTKFHLPKKISKLAISPPLSEQFSYLQGVKQPVVTLLKVAEDQFVYLSPKISNEKKFNLDVIAHADWITFIEENKLIDETFKDVGNWLTKYGAMIVMGLIFLSGLLTVHLVNQHSVELIEEHRGDALREVAESRDLLDRITETLNSGNTENKATQETDAPKPLGQS